MLRPLRKANAETRRVFNKALKTEAHSPLCKLYNLIEWLRQGNREIQGETRFQMLKLENELISVHLGHQVTGMFATI